MGAAKTLISESEYLQTSFEDPEPDYVEGEIIERGMPTNSHSVLQRNLVVEFAALEERLPLWVRPELRMRLPNRRYRIGDLAIFARNPPSAEIPPEIPYAVIEIVSPDDRYDEVVTKLDEYLRWGVAHVWLVDPGHRRISVYLDGELIRASALELPEFGEMIPADRIFRFL
jgi:Uma2 family endonuclease